MSFFEKEKPRSKALRKRKVGAAVSGKRSAKVGALKKRKHEDDITSEESDAENEEHLRTRNDDEYSASEDEDETADQKRKRLAQEHLENLKAYISSDDDDDDADPVARKLRQENLARRGRLHKDVASQLLQPTPEDITLCRGHKLPVTCVVLTPDNRFIFSGSKDCTLIKWDVETGKKVRVFPRGHKNQEQETKGHTSHVLCLAISSDGQYLASGDRSKMIFIWNPDTCQLLHTTHTRQHRNAVSGLAFRHGTHELFSASFDRTVKVWNVGESGIIYVETLFGHQDVITAIDALAQERCVTAGARDGSVRIWKIVEESQLVFHGHSGSIDCVCYIDDNHFFSGADDGSLAVWSTMKKKPLVSVPNAHSGDAIVKQLETGVIGDSAMEGDDGPVVQSSGTECQCIDGKAVPAVSQGDLHVMRKENWVTAVAALHNTDLLVSGSKDGFIRFWKSSNDYRTLTQLLAVPLVGFANSLQFSADGQLLIAGVGQEHKLGRWWHIKSAKNAVCILRLKREYGPRKAV